ncbi:hypothetical protein F5884DRAFT_6394 [Xylogone sp. PMI_703]|nr:hypothetical protein F5884DRAFT_6394 [Xylogone sp. PMI_703]
MCFFDQYLLSCQHYKWGLFQQHCANGYRTGKNCTMKLVMNTYQMEEKCKLCEKLEVKYRRKRKEEEHIERWEKESARTWRGNIERSREIIQGLEMEIEVLLSKVNTITLA